MEHVSHAKRIIKEEGIWTFLSKHLVVYVVSQFDFLTFAAIFLHNKPQWRELTWNIDNEAHKVYLYSGNFREYVGNGRIWSGLETDYGKLNVKGKVVVDIGANIGDSAIYFAFKKASKVFAFEPYPYTFNIAQKNIKINRLRAKIKLFRIGVSGKKGEIKIDRNYIGTGASTLKNFEKGDITEVITLEQLVKRYMVENAVLKMDVEGSEYEILSKTNSKTMLRFSEVILEYHHNKVSMLTRYLNKYGFRVVYATKPVYIYNKESLDPHFYSGIIYASRRH